MARGTDLFFNILANVKGERDVKQLGRDIDDLGSSVDRNSKWFKAWSDNAGHARAELTRSQYEVRRLSEEFNRTGNVDVFKQLRKEQGNVSRMTKVLQNLGDDTMKVDKLTALLQNHWVLAGAAGAAAMTLPLVGAAATGAALAGLSAGVIAFGAMGVRNSERVKGALEALSDTADTTLTNAASVLEGPFVGALERVRGTVASTESPLRRMFLDAAPGVERLSDGVDGFVQNIMPGLEAGLHGAEPVIEMLAQKLPEVGDAFGEFFAELGQHGPEAASGLATALDIVMVVIENTARMLGFFADMWERVARSPGAGPIIAALDKVAGSDSGIRSTAAATGALSGELKKEATSAQQAAFWTKSFAEASGLLNNQTLSWEKAANDASDATLHFKEALQASSGTIGRQTQASRAAENALIDGIHAASRMADANFDVTLSGEEATRVFYQQIGALRNQTKAGSVARATFDGLVAAFVRSQGPAFSSANAISRINTQINLLHDKQVTARARGDGSEVARLQRQIDALHGKTLLITVNRQYNNVLSGKLDYFGNPIAGRAGGGSVRRGVPYIVGERRPELFVPGQNGTIIPRVAAGGGTTVVNNYHLHATGPIGSQRELETWFVQTQENLRRQGRVA